MAAFIGLSALVVIAAMIAVLSLWMNRQSHDKISKQSIPIVTTALDLTRVAQRIVDTAPELVAAKTPDDQASLTMRLGGRVTTLNDRLEQLKEYSVDPRAAASIERAATLFAANIDAINRVVSARIAVETSASAQTETALNAVRDTLTLLDEYLEDRAEGLSRVLQSDPSIVAQRLRLLSGRTEMQEIELLLQSGGNRDVDKATLAFRTSLDAIRALQDDVAPEDREDLVRNVSVLEESLVGSNSLSQRRAFQSQLNTAADQALTENTDLAERFDGAVNRMINVAKSDVAEANLRAAEIQRTAFWMLLSVVVATILSSVLIVRLYVHRNILARLTALTSSMMAIANGDLSAEIPEPAQDELGSMAAALNVFRDTAVEVRDSNLREIQETRSRLHHAIESIQEGFALFDADNILILSNTRFGSLLLDDAEQDYVGKNYVALIKHMVDRGVIAEQNEDWFDRVSSYHAEPAGTEIWELKGDRWVGATERRTDDGGTVMVVTDLTAIKRHERELDDLVAKLQRASAAKSSFIANVSHELRTPLTAVLGFAQIVQSRLENVIFPRVDNAERATDRAVGQVRENIQIMIQEGQRLTKMINDILDLEKIEAGQMVWEVEALDMGSIIRQAAAATNSLYASKGLEFHTSIPEELPKVSGDRDRLVQVVINLISNAVKFTDRGHVACVVQKGAGSFVSISVSDTGVGISPEDQEEVFEKFRQVGDTLTDKPSGTGLGLPICREIVEHLGGTITVESMPGFGSTFTFQLPVADAGATAIKNPRRAHGT